MRFFPLPSVYPFSAQARASGRAGANLSSRLRRFILVAMTGSLDFCDSMVLLYYVSQGGCGMVRCEENQVQCGGECGSSPSSKTATDGAPTVRKRRESGRPRPRLFPVMPRWTRFLGLILTILFSERLWHPTIAAGPFLGVV
jgi:hypothetical protein